MIKILVVDDHALVRDGIVAMLNSTEGITVVGEAENGNEAVDKVSKLKPDIVIMDINMPGMGGLEAGKIIKEIQPTIKILFLSMEVSELFVSEGIKIGANGFLPKDSKKSDLIEAVTKINAGQNYFPGKVAEIIFQNFYLNAIKGPEIKRVNDKLSKREVEIVILITSGISNKAIADQLFISTRTVDAHRNHIMQKLSLKSTAELVKYALKNQYIKL